MWHMARRTENLQSAFPGMTDSPHNRFPSRRQQIWEAEGLARQWGFPLYKLGFDETGDEIVRSINEEMQLASLMNLALGFAYVTTSQAIAAQLGEG
jgi:hypothetical protein